MEHVVFYPSFDGSPAFRRVASLEDAARFVEHLRNVEDVTDFSVHALTPVPLSVRPWYRVEMPFEGQGQAAPAPEPYEAAAPEPAGLPVAELPVAEPAGVVMPAPQPQVAAVPDPVEPMTPELAEAVAGGRRSMGFFTR